MKSTWLNDLLQYIANVTVHACTVSGLEIYEAYRKQHLETFGNDSFGRLLVSTVDALQPQRLYQQLLDISTGTLEHLLYLIAVYFAVCLVLYFTLTRSHKFKRAQLPWPRNRDQQKRTLLVIAHPDDECMFFGPLIYTLTQRTNWPVYILCLSTGNYESLGKRRRDELWKACSQLGVPDSHIVLVNATRLPDNPRAKWRPDVVANLILHAIETLGIQMLVSFDPDGVSGHPNHCSIYYAAASLHMANLLSKDCKYYALDSINVVRKYLAMMDILCTCLMSKYWCILNWREAHEVRYAMQQHKSQMRWFRWFYIYFSRYMYINSLREINLSDVELEMQINAVDDD